MNNPFDTRLLVKLISAATPWNCVTIHYLHVGRLWPLSKEECIKLVNMAGFAGQDELVIKRWEEKLDNYNSFHWAEVKVMCDSGD